jgi:hypothetical protein
MQTLLLPAGGVAPDDLGDQVEPGGPLAVGDALVGRHAQPIVALRAHVWEIPRTYGPPEGELLIDLIGRLGDAFSFDDIEFEVVDVDGSACPSPPCACSMR